MISAPRQLSGRSGGSASRGAPAAELDRRRTGRPAARGSARRRHGVQAHESRLTARQRADVHADRVPAGRRPRDTARRWCRSAACRCGRWRAPGACAARSWSASRCRPTAARCRSRARARAGPAARRRCRPGPRPSATPTCCSQATPATVDRLADGQLRARLRGVDARRDDDRRLLHPALGDPVRVERGERRRLDVDDPLAGRHVPVQARHDHPHREAVLDRQRLRRPCRPRASRRARPSRRRSGCRSSCRPTSATPAGRRRRARRPRAGCRPAAPRGSGRCRSGCRRRTSLRDAGQRDPAFDQRTGEQIGVAQLDRLVDHAVDAQAPVAPGRSAARSARCRRGRSRPSRA